MSRTRLLRPAGVASLLAALVLGSAGCSISDLAGDDEASPSATPTASASPKTYESQFTKDGTFQSHINIANVDFVYTLYPTKSTPRTNEWYPKGKKYFSFTLQAYDLDRRLRDPFRSKRRVYVDHISVSSTVRTTDGGTSDEHPYSLDAVAKNVTFDPEPVTTEHGMLATSPKGAFELRNQAIQPTADDTFGIDLTFTATVWMERRAGSDSYVKKVVKQRVPIAIFPSDTPTQKQRIPVDAN
jgi:hypothetical protein